MKDFQKQNNNFEHETFSSFHRTLSRFKTYKPICIYDYLIKKMLRLWILFEENHTKHINKLEQTIKTLIGNNKWIHNKDFKVSLILSMPLRDMQVQLHNQDGLIHRLSGWNHSLFGY